MKRVFTVQEMRELAEMIDHGGAFTLTDPSIIEANVAMLRQAADMMVRESKYEYGVKFHGCDGSARIDNMHFRSLSEANEFNEVIGLDETTVVRREVGGWEEVMDGKDKSPDIDSDIEDHKFGLGIHITQEDLKKKYGLDDSICHNVLVGEWEDGK